MGMSRTGRNFELLQALIGQHYILPTSHQLNVNWSGFSQIPPSANEKLSIFLSKLSFSRFNWSQIVSNIPQPQNWRYSTANVRSNWCESFFVVLLRIQYHKSVKKPLSAVWLKPRGFFFRPEERHPIFLLWILTGFDEQARSFLGDKFIPQCQNTPILIYFAIVCAWILNVFVFQQNMMQNAHTTQ